MLLCALLSVRLVQAGWRPAVFSTKLSSWTYCVFIRSGFKFNVFLFRYSNIDPIQTKLRCCSDLYSYQYFPVFIASRFFMKSTMFYFLRCLYRWRHAEWKWRNSRNTSRYWPWSPMRSREKRALWRSAVAQQPGWMETHNEQVQGTDCFTRKIQAAALTINLLWRAKPWSNNALLEMPWMPW